MPATLSIGRHKMRLNIFRGSISWTTHSGCQTLRGRSETSRRIEKHASVSRLSDLSFPTMKPLRLQCSSLTQENTHAVTFLGVKNVTMWLQYDSKKKNHTKSFKKAQKTQKNAKIAKLHCSALQCTAMHNSETPQLLTPEGSNMTHNDPG